METTATVREAARAIIVNAQDEVLLFRAVFPAWGEGDQPRTFWIAPEGRLNEGEDYSAAARREAFEETGLDSQMGPCCWLRSNTFRIRDALVEQRERYFLCRVDEHEVTTERFEAEEVAFLQEHRWWSVQDMRASQQTFVPADFADRLEGILREGPPSEPIVVGV